MDRVHFAVGVVAGICIVYCVFGLFGILGVRTRIGNGSDVEDRMPMVAGHTSIKGTVDVESSRVPVTAAHEPSDSNDASRLPSCDVVVRLTIGRQGEELGCRCREAGMDVGTVGFVKWLADEYMRRIADGAKSVGAVVSFNADCSCADRLAALAVIAPMVRFNVKTMNPLVDGTVLTTELGVEGQDNRKYSSVEDYVKEVVVWKRKAESSASFVVATVDDGGMRRRSIADVCGKTEVAELSGIVKDALGNPGADLSISWRCNGVKYLEMMMHICESDDDGSKSQLAP